MYSFFKSLPAVGPQHQPITGFGVPKKLSAVPRELLIAYALFQCAGQFRRGGPIRKANLAGRPQQYLEPRIREVECQDLAASRKEGALVATTGKDALDEVDLERTRERFAQATIEDDRDIDMTD